MQADEASDTTNSHRLVACPYKVLVSGMQIDEFYDVRDAISSARALKRENTDCHVAVIDEPSARLVIQI